MRTSRPALASSLIPTMSNLLAEVMILETTDGCMVVWPDRVEAFTSLEQGVVACGLAGIGYWIDYLNKSAIPRQNS